MWVVGTLEATRLSFAGFYTLNGLPQPLDASSSTNGTLKRTSSRVGSVVKHTTRTGVAIEMIYDAFVFLRRALHNASAFSSYRSPRHCYFRLSPASPTYLLPTTGFTNRLCFSKTDKARTGRSKRHRNISYFRRFQIASRQGILRQKCQHW